MQPHKKSLKLFPASKMPLRSYFAAKLHIEAAGTIPTSASYPNRVCGNGLRAWASATDTSLQTTNADETRQIIAAEKDPERKALYQLCWHLGGSQGDIANLKGEDVDWTQSTVSFRRKKTGVPVVVHLGEEALNVFKDLPGEGVLFPYLSSVRANERVTEFRSRCRQLGIQGGLCTASVTHGPSGRKW